MLYRRVFRALLALAALGLLFSSLPLLADSQVRAVRISFSEGKVEIDRGDGRGFGTAFLNMPVVQGTRLSTGEDGKVEVELENGSTIRLVPNTTVEFPGLGRRDSGVRVTTVNLVSGLAYFNIGRDNNDFILNVAHQQLGLEHSSHFRVEANENQFKLAVIKGDVAVSGSAAPVTVRKDETLTLDLADPSRYYLSRDIASEEFDSWNVERDRYQDQYAASSYRSYSPYSYGVSDLNYYGSYVTVADYGPVWRPYYVGPQWSPYGDGAWVYYPGWGYSWVSAYPWGWLPYHYGNWVFLSSYGWCWHPGYWNRWTPVVAVVNPPVWYHAPQPPRVVGGPIVAVGHGPAPIFPPGVRQPGGGFNRLEHDAGPGSGRGRDVAVLPSGKNGHPTPVGGPVFRGRDNLEGDRGNSPNSGRGPGRETPPSMRETPPQPMRGTPPSVRQSPPQPSPRHIESPRAMAPQSLLEDSPAWRSESPRAIAPQSLREESPRFEPAPSVRSRQESPAVRFDSPRMVAPPSQRYESPRSSRGMGQPSMSSRSFGEAGRTSSMISSSHGGGSGVPRGGGGYRPH